MNLANSAGDGVVAVLWQLGMVVVLVGLTVADTTLIAILMWNFNRSSPRGCTSPAASSIDTWGPGSDHDYFQSDIASPGPMSETPCKSVFWG